MGDDKADNGILMLVNAEAARQYTEGQAPPMAILSATINTLSCFHTEFLKGLDDPDLALLEVRIDKAEYWNEPHEENVKVSTL
mgnify:CR=1 FL=1